VLTADLVRVQRRGDLLTVKPLHGPVRQRALALAGAYLDLAAAHAGGTRGDLDEAFDAVEVGGRDGRLAEGLKKLVLDRCVFEMAPGQEPVELRRQLFRAAAAARRAVPHGHGFDRAALLAEIAAGRGLEPPAIEAALFADLHQAHRLQGFRPLGAEALVDAYDCSQTQAVLLRALRVRVSVYAVYPSAYRRLFHRLKFLRLLFSIARQDDGGYRLEIDGPCSLFDAVTKYGLQLALVLPALEECTSWELEADVLWGRDRQRCRFIAAGGTDPLLERDGEASGGVPLADDVAGLVERFRTLDTPWSLEPHPEILDLPGVGVCVPDLTFRHRDTGEVVYLEVLGFWSREAVWKRVDLVQAGLPYRVLFAVSERLRVSADVLEPEARSALYVYKGVMNARRIAELLELKKERR